MNANLNHILSALDLLEVIKAIIDRERCRAVTPCQKPCTKGFEHR